MDRQALLDRARTRGVRPLVYWPARAVLQPFFHVWFRLERIGREHIPARGPLILAANHRSFLDPFVIAIMVRRPIYFVAKKELFLFHPVISWVLSSLGAFPIDRGGSDQDAMATAKAILERGDVVLMFPEGTRIRPGSLGRPRRGVGRLALETGAPVVPVAVIGTEAVRAGWRIRPRKVRIRAGRALRFARVPAPSPAQAAAVTDRIWPCVELQWEWLGGLPRLRRAAVIGAGATGTSLAVALARAGLSVDLGARTAEKAARLRDARANERELPGVTLPEAVRVARAAELELQRHDVVCFAVPGRDLPAAVAAHGEQVPARAGVVVLSGALVPPAGALPSAYVAQRVRARAVACLGGAGEHADALAPGGALVVASTDEPFLAQLAEVLGRAGLDVQRTSDVVGVQLAGAATSAALAAAAAASVAGPGAAGAAAGRVFAEVGAYARASGGRAETLAGPAGAGDVVATVVAEARARGGAPAAGGRAGEGLDELELLAGALAREGIPAPAIAGLAAVAEGRVEAERWAATLTAATGEPRRASAA